MSIAHKMARFAEQSSWIRKMFEEGARLKAQYGAEKVCDFSLGNPDLTPPAAFQQTLKELISSDTAGVHGYMPNGGFPEVRQSVARQVSVEQGATVEGNDILLTCGAAGALNVTMKALLDPGDEVILIAPFFVEYNFYVDNHGGVAKVAPSGPDFALDPAAVAQAISSKTKAIIINSPNNPTGQVYDAEALAELSQVLTAAGKKHGRPIYLIADEPYRKIVFDNVQVPAILKAHTHSILVTSYSKDLSLAGERIGYLAVNPEIPEKPALMNALTLANRILGFVNAPALMQRVVGRLQGVSVDAAIYQQRRDLFCAILAEAGYQFFRPKGAFYLFPKSPLTDEVAFINVLRDEKVLAVPGRGFGTPGFFRLAFCVDQKIIERSAPAFKRAMEIALASA